MQLHLSPEHKEELDSQQFVVVKNAVAAQDVQKIRRGIQLFGLRNLPQAQRPGDTKLNRVNQRFLGVKEGIPARRLFTKHIMQWRQAVETQIWRQWYDETTDSELIINTYFCGGYFDWHQDVIKGLKSAVAILSVDGVAEGQIGPAIPGHSFPSRAVRESEPIELHPGDMVILDDEHLPWHTFRNTTPDNGQRVSLSAAQISR